jgi:hypothetical protein
MNLLIIPWGTPHWSPKSPNISEVTRLYSHNTRILYLLPFWGFLGISAITHNPEILKFVAGIGLKGRELEKETSLQIRSWLKHNSNKYQRIVFLSYANGGKFWSSGAAGLPEMKKVKIVTWKPTSPNTVKKDILRWIK